MARTLPKLTSEEQRVILTAWRSANATWSKTRDARKAARIAVLMRLVRNPETNAADIANEIGISRATVFNYLRDFRQGGLQMLLQKSRSGLTNLENIRKNEKRRQLFVDEILEWAAGRRGRSGARKG